nr:hypothetical protein [Tanacetum cinerariifolium]
MSTLAYFDSEIIYQTIEPQSFQIEEFQPLVSRAPHTDEEFEASEPSNTRITTSHSSASSDSTTPLSRDHPLTQASPTPTPTRVLFHRRTARMAMRTQPTLSPGMSARIAKEAALSLSSFHKRYRSSYETSSSSPPSLPIRKRYRGASKLVEDIKDESSDLGIDRDSSKGEGHSSKGEGHGSKEEGPGSEDEGPSIVKKEEAKPEGEGSMPNTFEVGQSSRSIPEHEGERGYLHLDIPPLLQGFTITRVVPSPIDSPVTTLASTKSVDKDQFLRGYDRDLRELYTRSGMVRDEIFFQRENHDLRRQIVEERLERLKLLDRVVRMEKRQESRGGVVDYMRFLIRSLYTIKLSRFN